MDRLGVALHLELRRRLALLPPLLGGFRVEGEDVDAAFLQCFDEGLIARRLVGRGDAHQGQGRRAAGAEDDAEAEEHQQREGEGPEHGGAGAHVEPPLDLELAPEKRERVGKGRWFHAIHSRRLLPVSCRKTSSRVARRTCTCWYSIRSLSIVESR